MLYIFLTIALLAISALLFTSKFKAFTQSYAVACNFILTLIATLIGVLLAIVISNYDADRKEIKDLIKVLYAAEAVIEESLEYSVSLNEAYKKNIELYGEQQTFFTRNPLVYPQYLDNMLTQNLVSKNITVEGLSEISEHLIILQRAQKVEPDTFIASMRYIKLVITLERRFQNAELLEHDYKQMLNDYEEELIHQQLNNQQK